jgi:hypothetical protein
VDSLEQPSFHADFGSLIKAGERVIFPPFKPVYDTKITSSVSLLQGKAAPSVLLKTRQGNLTVFPPLTGNDTYRIFSTSGHKKILSPSETNGKAQINNKYNNDTEGKIAFVAPTFTTAAYDNSFYRFFAAYKGVPHAVNITTDVNLLTSKVRDQPFTKIKSKYVGLGSNIAVITDEDVHEGSIFTRHISVENNITTGGVGSEDHNAYDVLLLGHQEYVTQQEYTNLKHFVANGGTLIILDGNVFYAEVKYDNITDTITLVKGHGWAYNGMTAWKSIGERWLKENSEWVGSNFLPCVCPLTFANDPFEYKHHEEQYITNHNDKILVNYKATLLTKHPASYLPVIATYELHYGKGRVIVLGIYAEDVLTNSRFDKFLQMLLLQNIAGAPD